MNQDVNQTPYQTPYQTPNLLAPQSWTSQPPEINVCCLSPPGLRYYIIAARTHEDNSGETSLKNRKKGEKKLLT